MWSGRRVRGPGHPWPPSLWLIGRWPSASARPCGIGGATGTSSPSTLDPRPPRGAFRCTGSNLGHPTCTHKLETVVQGRSTLLVGTTRPSRSGSRRTSQFRHLLPVADNLTKLGKAYVQRLVGSIPGSPSSIPHLVDVLFEVLSLAPHGPGESRGALDRRSHSTDPGRYMAAL